MKPHYSIAPYKSGYCIRKDGIRVTGVLSDLEAHQVLKSFRETAAQPANPHLSEL